MIPTLRAVWLVALGIPLALLGLFDPFGLMLTVGYNITLVVLVAVDLMRSSSPALASVRYDIQDRWVQGRPGRAVLRVRWNGRRSGWLVLRDLPPVSFRVNDTRFDIRVHPGSRDSTVSYPAVPLRRGTHAFGPIAIRSRGPFGLIERQRIVDEHATVRVYPDLVTLSAREASLVAPSTWHTGTRRGRLVGEGREFHQLRDYTSGDDVRMVDWKAFAHRGRPVVREYRPERNQRVLILIDGGRLMTARVGDRLRFDWAVQAAGRLARVALVMGDVVGLAVFSREITARVPASRGPSHLGVLADTLCHARPDLDEPNLGGALHSLIRGHPRRTLLVLFTEIADPSAAETTLRHVGALAPRHLGVVVTLADTDLEAERELPLTGTDAAFRRAAAEELWHDYRTTQQSLEDRGAYVVRARADALAGDAVERYVEIKRQGRL